MRVCGSEEAAEVLFLLSLRWMRPESRNPGRRRRDSARCKGAGRATACLHGRSRSERPQQTPPQSKRTRFGAPVARNPSRRPPRHNGAALAAAAVHRAPSHPAPAAQSHPKCWTQGHCRSCMVLGMRLRALVAFFSRTVYVSRPPMPRTPPRTKCGCTYRLNPLVQR